MPNLNLTDAQAQACSPLPGRALLKVQSRAQLREPGQMIYKPESVAQGELERQAVREGEVIRINRSGKGMCWRRGESGRSCTVRNPNRKYKFGPVHDDEDSLLIQEGSTVYYLGHQDEMDNQYVVVKLGQIVAVKENGNGTV